MLQVAKRTGRKLDLVLNRYAVERLLYRLARSRHADLFVLKGATLLMNWFDEPLRITRDLDLLGYGDPTPEAQSPAFAGDELKKLQWEAFRQDVVAAPGSLAGVVATLEAFLMPAAAAALQADNRAEIGPDRSSTSGRESKG